MEQITKDSNAALQLAVAHSGPGEHPILKLQRTAGNQAVLRWLRARAGKQHQDVRPQDGVPSQSADTEGVQQAEPADRSSINTTKAALIGVLFVLTFGLVMAYMLYGFKIR